MIPYDLDLYTRMLSTSKECFKHWYSYSLASKNCDNKPILINHSVAGSTPSGADTIFL